MMHILGQVETLIFVLAFLACRSLQQDQISGFCRRWQHQTCVLDDKLYIDGGVVSAVAAGAVQSFTNESIQANTRLLYEDLSDPQNGLPIQNDSLTKDSDVPSVSGGNLWPDEVNKKIYLYGGEYHNGQPAKFDLWYYDVLGNNWSYVHPDGSQGQISRASFGAGTVIADQGLAYYYGGYLSNNSVADWNAMPMMLNTVVTYDMVNNQWTNATFGQSSNQAGRAEGALQYLPISDRGMLIYFGGLQQSSDGSIDYLSMDQIDVYDIAAGKWYTQSASGDIPQPRSGFCAGMVSAQDRSSYNIYVYGGMNATGGALGDIYVLTLPSFEWTYFYPNASHAPSLHGKAFSSCNVYAGGSQMMIIGGYVSNQTYSDCDGNAIGGGQHNLALGQQNPNHTEWWQVLPNVTAYDVPWQVTSVIGGGATGGATVTEPTAGWATSDLSVYFGRSYSAVTRTPTRPVPASATATGTSSNAPSVATSPKPMSPAKQTNVGAIASGTVGGVVVVIAAIAIAVYCLRKRRKQGTQGQSANPSSGRGQQSSTWDKGSVNATLTPSLSGTTAYYSPQNSPPFQENALGVYNQHQHHISTEWSPAPTYYSGSTQGTTRGRQQAYYAPQELPDMDESSLRVELPSIRSPVILDGLPTLRKSPR